MSSPFSRFRKKQKKSPAVQRRHTIGPHNSEAKPVNLDVNVSHLIAAFEHRFIPEEDQAEEPLNISEEDYQVLFAKETVRLKKSTRGNLKDLFQSQGVKKTPGSQSDSQSDSSVEFSPENWRYLDTAKKERRISAFLQRRPTAKNLLHTTLEEVIPSKNILKDSGSAISTKETLVTVPCKGWCMEVGFKTTTYETQLKFLCVLQSETQNYYEEYFYGRDHHSYYADDDIIGPVVLSIQAEGQGDDRNRANSRVLIRTKKVDIWDFVPAAGASTMLTELKDREQHQFLKELKFKKIKNPEFPASFLAVERKLKLAHLKFGVMYMKPGQTTDDEMFSNVETSPQYEEFLGLLGDKIVLKDWDKFSGGLDVKSNTTGSHSVYVNFQDREIMFHVSTLLPFDEDDKQRVERKRHIGNDIVVIVFLDDEECVFDPRCVKSEFNHVFAVVAVDKKKTTPSQTYYRIAFAYKEPMEPCAPYISVPVSFKKDENFRSYFLTKLLNAEYTSIQSPMFAQKLSRTKAVFLRNMLKVGD